MLINNEQNNSFIPKSETRFEMTINNSAKAFMLLSDSVYTNPIHSIMRELVSNAIDASLMHKDLPNEEKPPVIIHLPDNLYDDFFVQDFGVGMSLTTVLETFDTYFNSTKETSADDIGGFGLGGKTPFLYTNEFKMETTSPEDGVRRTFVYRADFDNGSMGKPYNSYLQHLDVADSEIKGTKISFKLKSNDDIVKFYKTLSQVIFFDYPIQLEYKDYTLNDYLENVQLDKSIDFIKQELNNHQLCILNGDFSSSSRQILSEPTVISRISAKDHYVNLKLSEYINVRLGGILYRYELDEQGAYWKKYEQLTSACILLQMINQSSVYDDFIHHPINLIQNSVINKMLHQKFVVILDNKVNGLIKLDVARENIRKTEHNTKIITEQLFEQMNKFIHFQLDKFLNNFNQIHDDLTQNKHTKSVYHYFNAKLLLIMFKVIEDNQSDNDGKEYAETLGNKINYIKEKLQNFISYCFNELKQVKCYQHLLHRKKVINHHAFSSGIALILGNELDKDAKLEFGSSIYGHEHLANMYQHLFNAFLNDYGYSLHSVVHYLAIKLSNIHTIVFNSHDDKTNFHFKQLKNTDTLLALNIVTQRTKRKLSHILTFVDNENVDNSNSVTLINPINASTFIDTYQCIMSGKSKEKTKARKIKQDKPKTYHIGLEHAKQINEKQRLSSCDLVASHGNANAFVSNNDSDGVAIKDNLDKLSSLGNFIFIPMDLPIDNPHSRLDSAFAFRLIGIESATNNQMLNLFNKYNSRFDSIFKLIDGHTVIVSNELFEQMQLDGKLHPKYPILFQVKSLLDNILIKSYQEVFSFDSLAPLDMFTKNIEIYDGQRCSYTAIPNVIGKQLERAWGVIPFELSQSDLISLFFNDKFIDCEKDVDVSHLHEFKNKITQFISSKLQLDVNKNVDSLNFSIQILHNGYKNLFYYDGFQSVLCAVAFMQACMQAIHENMNATNICKYFANIADMKTYNNCNEYMIHEDLILNFHYVQNIATTVINNIVKASEQYYLEQGYQMDYLNMREFTTVIPFLLHYVLSNQSLKNNS